ncbi:thioesterase family protein [Seleniivibrio woodruffii]|uniref:Fluoroacetyl-CoA thioesterase n=2 Tax=Seleniivibrio woodruffii TaxID=1078050 RepID=A0A4R1KBN2_9BACT|nr:thioesterase family protein [Seleniivibrio woodruffii]TCK61916.1 fluoroacetyl-CoA thioesterase [Seleniivibrio woodruffii]TVZ34967.1 Thioesterase superfamily [Seleniivibrio woodruffii]
MKDSIKAELEHEIEFTVNENKTVPKLYPESELFRTMPEVFATGFMVGFMEWACMDALAPHLDEGEHSVGVHVNVSHCAATPVGMKVRAKVRCTAVDGQKTSWYVEAYDEKELIGKGSHDRFTINVERFNQRVAKKAQSPS